jgi:nitroimidazol reductase NimA-like FMN-containing flavoprotein (pyridoxamine 5'-phosphate oxidase superfamily)
MLIHEMTDQECLDTLARSRLGRLGCAREDQPYVTPIYFALHKRQLYAFSTLGQKIEWMRANPRVCVEADELTAHSQWMSVVVFCHYEEFPDTPAYQPERNRAHEVLQQRAMWWEPASAASPHHSAADSLAPVFYRIRIDQVTGHQAMPDPVDSATLPAPESATKSEGWLSNVLRRPRIPNQNKSENYWPLNAPLN